ncbi:MAG TPA: NAD-binding protein [Anaerolineales bacterium]|nr:NAD-binding protein [Anaerolineales bacterium]HMX17761.1 NAD-binding protein [Anaerolineales bacterium]HMX75086.1 NAD-binding protein [Anaerolineales bacterium]HMZ43981.1 NAD-binding protein [Anaerolineales bacterium]HNA55305.1 NAD-binding protein [Anaerolineales bacterium]
MFVLITGGGRTGARLANLLLNEKYKVRLVENRRNLLSLLHQELPTEVIYEGNPSDPSVLEAAGIREAHAVASVTGDDSMNLAISFIAKQMFGVPRTIARVNNPNNAWLFDEKFHVDVSLNQADVLAHLIQEEMSLGDMMTLFKIRRGRYAVVEEKVPAGAKAIGVQLREMGLAEHCVIAAIIRDGVMTLPRGDSTLKEFDEIIAVASPEGAKRLAELLADPAHPDRNDGRKA